MKEYAVSARRYVNVPLDARHGTKANQANGETGGARHRDPRRHRVRRSSGQTEGSVREVTPPQNLAWRRLFASAVL